MSLCLGASVTGISLSNWTVSCRALFETKVARASLRLLWKLKRTVEAGAGHLHKYLLTRNRLPYKTFANRTCSAMLLCVYARVFHAAISRTAISIHVSFFIYPAVFRVSYFSTLLREISLFDDSCDRISRQLFASLYLLVKVELLQVILIIVISVRNWLERGREISWRWREWQVIGEGER